MNEMIHLKICAEELAREGCGAHFAIRFGTLDRYSDFCFGNGVNAETNFDMASVTKIFCTTTLALMAMDEGMFAPDTLVSAFFPVPEDKKTLTIRCLMTHSMGFGHKPLNFPQVTYDNVAEYILNIPCEFPVGTETEYCCPAFILLGKILEKVYGRRLEELFRERVTRKLGLTRTGFGSEKLNTVNSNSAEEECGLVNDYNCRHLGGTVGNAGVYSNLNDLTRFVGMLLHEGAPLIRPETFRMARQNLTPTLSASRGLGYLYVDERYHQTGRLFPAGSFGHCGHTGQSVFVCPENGFFTVILSDMTVRAGGEYDRVIAAREKLHNAILADLEEK